MKLKIKRKAAIDLEKRVRDLADNYAKITLKLPKDLVEILLNDKKWAEMNAVFILSNTKNKVKMLTMIEEYEREKSKTNPNFKELVNFKTEFRNSFVKELPELVPLINGESKYKFIRELDRLILGGPPSTEKNKFFGLLFVLFAVGGIFGTTIGILASQGLKDWFAANGLFEKINFLKDLSNGHGGLLNIASWYVAFEILGFKGMNLLRKDDVFQIPRSLENKKSSRISSKDGSYMAIQNLKTIKMNSERLLNISKNPNFGPMITNEHAWAADHLAVAAENIDQVADFFEAQFEVKAKKI